MMRYFCCHERRLRAVKEAGAYNGIEYVEVRDSDEPVPALRQRTLYVRLLLPVPATLTGDNVVIDGGERIRSVAVTWAAPATALPGTLTAAEKAALLVGLDEPGHVLVVRTDDRGDFSRYVLHLVAGAGTSAPPTGFDPLLVEVDFSFKVECPSDFDCAPQDSCPPQPHPAPPIDYLVKDYQGFRRIMLERMSLLTPGWTERNPTDVGVTLVELLAYTADELSYRQDAIATEAYLGTARSRVSLRRHARLVDYRVHEGCNARAWVRIQVNAPTVTLPAGTALLTRIPELGSRIEPLSREHQTALAARPVVFETVEAAVLHSDLDELSFYTWGEQHCCLPRGATSATLRGKHSLLQAGDVLVLAETVSPTKGEKADADPTRRWAVRLVDVRCSTDPSGGLFANPPTSTSVDVTEITWRDEDALPFPLCVTAGDGDLETAIAWGNIVLADHGATVAGEDLGTVPAPHLVRVTAAGRCDQTDPDVVPARYRPVLAQRPLTHVVATPSDATLPPASTGTLPAPRMAVPAITLDGELDGVSERWMPKPDLLASDGDAREFTVEAEHDGTAVLRFGDDEHGLRPDEGTTFTATYRIGNGVAGNVGAEALAHAVTTVTAVTGVSNPLPAAGGVNPESADEVRRNAPAAFQVQERAVTEADYAEVTERLRTVQRARATMRWTGSWHTVFVTADRFGGQQVDTDFEVDLRAHLERYRMAGYDLEVEGPRFVPLEIRLLVCVARGHFRADVADAVLDALSNRVLPDGRRGLFHPDNLTFGQPVSLSSVYAAAHAVPGVESVTVHTFRRQRQPQSSGLDSGVLPMGRLEIARLDADPNFPERGVLDLTLGGGT